MDIPRRGQAPACGTPLPAIRVQDSHPSDRYPDIYPDQQRYHSTAFPTPAAGPMSIPNAREPPPPPLPPPRYIPDIAENGRADLGWQWGNQNRDDNWGGAVSVPAGSSLYGSYISRKSVSDERPDVGRRGSTKTTTTAHHTLKDASNHANALAKDEGYSSLSASSASIGSTQ